MLIYIAVVVFGASMIELWTARLIGATVAWVITVALVGFFQVMRVSEDRQFTRQAVRRAVEFAAILDAYLNLLVLPFAAEMFLVPFLVFLGALLGVAQFAPELESDEYDPARSCLKSLVSIIGIVAIGYATYRVFGEVASAQGLGELGRGLLLPLWLNLALIPCTLLIGVWAAYQTAFIRLGIHADLSRENLRRSKLALIREVGLRVYALGSFGPPWPYRFSQATTLAEARSVARELVEERESAAVR